ncbi:uncharacterized protein RAG0_02847 [Rhynchosporium agropyri]|uniref:Uncharacterized protein n=1 Tax=Rhynchosporium agropyri TaxID=914238 RepID=A0A1E1K2Q9_9HELO|nr:uncharacterized protein RAG0_02847 [Rhynchosporium agropyri]
MTTSVSSCDSRWDPFDDLAEQQSHTQADNITLCRLIDWDSEREYDEEPPNHIRYSIEWKVTVNNRAIMPKDTEQDVVLAPSDYWEHFLEPKLKMFLHKKNRPLKAENTTVVVSITARSTPPLTKLFDDIKIDWSVIERQFIAWSELVRAGKKPKLTLSFNYVDTSLSTTTSVRPTGKRVRASRTQQMLAGRAAQIDEEEEASGRPSTWASVYRLMRCPGSCSSGPYCWVDPHGKKHYRISGPLVESLVEYIEEGHTLETHEDVPEHIRQELYDAAHRSLEAHKKSASTPAGVAPVTINMPPAPACQSCASISSPATTLVSNTCPVRAPVVPLGLPGFLDEQVAEYCAWQQSRVLASVWKADCIKACNVMINNAMDLNLIRANPDPQFLIAQGVSEGTAKRIVSDVDYWFERTKRRRIE